MEDERGEGVIQCREVAVERRRQHDDDDDDDDEAVRWLSL